MVTRGEDLALLAEAWDDLLLQASRPTPSLSYAWIASFLEHQLPATARWLCLLAREGARVEGVLPITVSPHPWFGFRAPIVAAPHGPHLFSAGLLTRAGREREILTALHEELLRRFPTHVVFSLSRTESRSAAVFEQQTFDGRARSIGVWDGTGYYLPIDGQYGSYMNRLGGEFRRGLRRAERGLTRERELRFSIIRGGDIADTHLDRFYALEAAGWKGDRGSAILSDPARRAFYAALAGRLRQRGWLELAFLSGSDEDLAGLFAVRLGKTLTLWKIGFNPRVARFSPGNLLLSRLIETAFADPGLSEVDLLTDAAWLAHWRLPARDYFNLSVFPRRPTAFLFGEAPARLGIALRRLPGVRTTAARLRALRSKRS